MSAALAWSLAAAGPLYAAAAPYIPASDEVVLAEIPAGARHASSPALAAIRLDVALPLARLDIARARAAADLRFLGYAEALLAPWTARSDPPPEVLVLDAEILQSRHAFEASLAELDRALAMRPNDAQGWLTRATVLRVLGRFDDAKSSCDHLALSADAAVAALCIESLRALTGHLEEAYGAIRSLSPRTPETSAWRLSELGEMAVRLGDDAAAEQWFRSGLERAPQDLYMRLAFADLLLWEDRPAEVLELLAGRETIEPALLRLVIAHRRLRDGAGGPLESRLSAAFEVELSRGEAIHRREQARYLLDVEGSAAAALDAARENWRVQREPDDALILLRSAAAAGERRAAASVLEFLQRTGLQDRRFETFRGGA